MIEKRKTLMDQGLGKMITEENDYRGKGSTPGSRQRILIAEEWRVSLEGS